MRAGHAASLRLELCRPCDTASQGGLGFPLIEIGDEMASAESAHLKQLVKYYSSRS